MYEEQKFNNKYKCAMEAVFVRRKCGTNYIIKDKINIIYTVII